VGDDIGVQAEEYDTEYRGFAGVWMRVVTVADEVPSYETDRQETILEEYIEERIVRGVDHALVWEVGIDDRGARVHEEPQDTLRTISRDQTERISDEFCPDLTHEHPPAREREELVWREECISDDYERTTYDECEDERNPVFLLSFRQRRNLSHLSRSRSFLRQDDKRWVLLRK
jgi:hypothetical protein